jgi:hypothetical protein
MSQFFKGLAIFCLVVLGLYGCSSYVGGRFLGMLAGTTTDPRQLGLVETSSMTPVTLKLISNTYRHDHRCPPPERDCFTVSRLPTPAFITFKIPAAYINQADVRLGNNEGQFISFELWSETFDPVKVDIVVDKIRCAQTAGCPDYLRMSAADSQVAKRRAAGEYEFYISMHNGINDKAGVLKDFTLSANQLTNWRNFGPCQISFDDKLGMTVSQPPDGIEPRKACVFEGGQNCLFPGRNIVVRICRHAVFSSWIAMGSHSWPSIVVLTIRTLPQNQAAFVLCTPNSVVFTTSHAS